MWPAELPVGADWSNFQHPVLSRTGSGGNELVDPLLKQLRAGQIIIPHYQRAAVWTPQQQAAFVGYVLEGGRTTTVFVREVDTDSGIQDELVDGQQRLRALCAFEDGLIPAVFPRSGLCAWKSKMTWSGWRTKSFPTCRFTGTDQEAMSLYLSLNSGGTVHTPEELDRVRRLIADSM